MAYQVVNGDKAISQFEEISEHFERISELQQAINWLLERNPRHTSSIDLVRGNCRLWITGQLPTHFPTLKVVYKINDEIKLVTILSVGVWTPVDPKLQ